MLYNSIYRKYLGLINPCKQKLLVGGLPGAGKAGLGQMEQLLNGFGVSL